MDEIPRLHAGTEHTHTTTRLVKNGKITRDTFATVGDKDAEMVQMVLEMK